VAVAHDLGDSTSDGYEPLVAALTGLANLMNQSDQYVHTGADTAWHAVLHPLHLLLARHVRVLPTSLVDALCRDLRLFADSGEDLRGVLLDRLVALCENAECRTKHPAQPIVEEGGGEATASTENSSLPGIAHESTATFTKDAPSLHSTIITDHEDRLAESGPILAVVAQHLPEQHHRKGLQSSSERAGRDDDCALGGDPGRHAGPEHARDRAREGPRQHRADIPRHDWLEDADAVRGVHVSLEDEGVDRPEGTPDERPAWPPRRSSPDLAADNPGAVRGRGGHASLGTRTGKAAHDE
jgi:hypothetical protein